MGEADERPERQEPTDESKAAAKTQTDFIDNFEIDEEDLGEDAFEEGQPVKKLPAEAPAPAQSREASEVQPKLDANGQPITPPKAAEPAPVPGAPVGEQPPAQPTPTAQAAPVGEEPAAPVARTQEQVQEGYREWRGQVEGLLATNHYNLSSEQLAELELNPGEFIPKMMSRVYLDSVTATLAQVVNYLPQMIRSVQETHTKATAAEDKFYERWPNLKDHHATVLRVGQVYRQLNPGASMEDFINEVGAQTMIAMRIPPEELARHLTAPKPNGNAAATAAARAAPFQPAATSPAGRPAPATPKNPFEALAEEFEEELSED